MTTLVELGDFRGVATLTHGRRWGTEDKSSLVLYGSRIISVDFMAIPAGDLRRRHSTVTVLFYYAGGRITMAGHTGIITVGPSIYLFSFSFSHSRRLSNGQGN